MNRKLEEIIKADFDSENLVKLFYANQQRIIMHAAKNMYHTINYSSYFLSAIYDKFYQENYYIPYSKGYFTSKYVKDFDHGANSERKSINFYEREIEEYEKQIELSRKMEKEKQLKQFLEYQRMKSLLVKKGYDALDPEAQNYWDNAY